MSGSYMYMYLFKLGQLQRVVVLGAKLHEPHVGGLRQLSDDVGVRKQSEQHTTLQLKVLSS